MMHWQYTPYVLPLFLAAAISGALALYVWSRRRVRGETAFVLHLLALAEWSLGYALELGSSDLPTKIFWAKVEYLGIVIVPVAWLAFVLQYTGRDRWLTRDNLSLAAIVPFVTLLLVWTNDVHGLMASSVRLDTSGTFSIMVVNYGPWFWISTAYFYLFVFFGTSFLVVRVLVRSPVLYRGQASSMLVGALLPWISDLLFISGLSPFPQLDLTPFAFSLSGLALAWGLFHFRLLDIVPIARDAIIEGMDDAVMVLDAQNRIVDLNPAAQRVIGHSASAAIGQSAAQLFSDWPDLVERYHNETKIHAEIAVGEGEVQRDLDLRISPLHERHGRLTGRLLLLRDISDRKQAEEQIQASLKEKEVLLQEVHHRVKNNMQIISSLLKLQSRYVKDDRYLELLKESEKRIDSMALIHEKLYQSEDLGRIDFSSYISSLANDLFQFYSVDPEKIVLELDVDDIVLGVDTAIPCGLIVNELVSNCLKHAFPDGTVGAIEVVLHMIDENEIELVVSDNGVGMPEGMNLEKAETLGLYLVTNLATKQLMGKLELDGAEGTEFRFRFKEPKFRKGIMQ